MELFVKRFQELTLEELYELLRLRVSVFVVEQNCPYMELDDRDQAAIHVFLKEDGKIRACMRILDRGVKSEHVSIGRVIAVQRRSGVGTRLLKAGIRAARECFGADSLYVEAQTYARGLYAKQGFVQISDEFLDEGVPHVKMLLEKIPEDLD